MCFWQWMVANKEVIMVFSNLASVVVMIFVGIALFMSVWGFNLQKKTAQASLFHNITAEVNSLLKDELKHCDKNDNEKDTYVHWLDLLLTALENYAYYANRGYVSKEMSEFYMPVIESFCEKTKKDYKDLATEIAGLKDQLVYCELRKYYKKFIKKECPI